MLQSISILKGKKVVVTGGTGFIGSNLVNTLLQKNANVLVIDKKIQKKSLFVEKNLRDKAELQLLDILKLKWIKDILLSFRPEYIFHLAAQTIVTQAYNDPLETFESNIMGTINILEASRSMPFIKGVIFASSDKAYGKTTNAYNENSPLKGDHPYDVSKSSADLIAQTYFKTYNVPVTISRFGNVYGEGDLHMDRIIPGICKAIIKKKQLQIRSDGTYIRDYIYVKDVVDGYLLLAQNIDKTIGNAYNFSSEDTLSVLDVVKKAEKVLNTKIPYTILNTAKNEIPYQHLDGTKVRALGWKSNYTMEDALPATFSWYNQILS